MGWVMEWLKEHYQFDCRWYLRVQSDGSLLPSDEGYWIGRPYPGDDHSPPGLSLSSLALSDGGSGSEPKGARYPISGHATGEKGRGC